MFGQKYAKNPCHHVQSSIEVTEGQYTVYNHPDIAHVVEYMKKKFYFATLLNGRRIPRSVENIYFVNIDNKLVYNNFYKDFGPLNLACLYRYCCLINRKLKNHRNKTMKIVHYTTLDQNKRANAAFLVGSFAVLYLNKTPIEAYKSLNAEGAPSLKPFQDASMRASFFTINLLDCFNGIYKATRFGFFNFNDFNVAEYEKYMQVGNGDLNWMVPQKFLAFLGPSAENGTLHHPPEHYINYFLKNNVVAVVRLNRKAYTASRFTKVGIAHYDMFMPDGGIPSRNILNQFLEVAENTNGAIAVHCKAGLGRTGTLIGAYLIKHYKMTAKEAIAWLRICRPGCVIGYQQIWLESMENILWQAGIQYRLKYYNNERVNLFHKRGIYSTAQIIENRMKPIFNKERQRFNYSERYAKSPPSIAENLLFSKKEKVNKSQLTQGDLLNKLKLKREERSEFSSFIDKLEESRQRM